MVLLQLFAAGADIDVGFRIVGEVAARESSVLALGLVEHLNVGLDPALIHQPTRHLRRAVACVGDHTRRARSNCSAVRSSIVLAAPTSAWRIAVVASTSMITAFFKSTR